MTNARFLAMNCLMGLALVGCAEEGFDDLSGDQQDNIYGVVEVTKDQPTSTHSIPMENIGYSSDCAMGARVSMDILKGSGTVVVENMRYYAGSVAISDDVTREIYGTVWGGVLNELNTDSDWWDWQASGEPFGEKSSQASVLAMSSRYSNIFAHGYECEEEYNNGRKKHQGQAALQFDLTLTEGDSAVVGYDLDWYHCGVPDAEYTDTAQQEVCDDAWGEIEERLVGKSYETSSCPPLVEDCALYDEVFGSKKRVITKADVHLFARSQCVEETLVDCS